MIEDLEATTAGALFRAVHVIGMGACTSNGLAPQTVVTSTRAGTRRHSLLRHQRNRTSGEPIRVSLLSTLPVTMPVAERMRRLAAAAAEQALVPWREALAVLPASERALPVLIATPQERPGISAAESGAAVRSVVEGLGIEVDRQRSGVVATSHEGGLAALIEGASRIDRGDVAACLIGGVDSCADPDTIDLLASLRRLKTTAVPDGIIPGEGAGFVLLCGAKVLARAGLSSFADVVTGARTAEPHPWYLPEPTIGEGLTKALWGALQPGGKGDVRTAAVTYADLTGEHWRAEEWSFAYQRTGRFHGHPLRVEHPGDRWGDVGAAFGPLLVVHAALDFHDLWNPGDSALVWAASDVNPLRTACLLSRPTP